jgi:hypothetical protein
MAEEADVAAKSDEAVEKCITKYYEDGRETKWEGIPYYTIKTSRLIGLF